MSKHNFNRNFAIIIGINNYENGIRKLETAVPDARKLAEIIKKQHLYLKDKYQKQNKYKVKLLLNEQANLNNVKQLIEDFEKRQITLDNKKVTVTEDDRLLFYFAGHGIAFDALENQEGPVGYLIPQDATSGDSSTYLPMQDLHDALKALPCRHMLAILDCCFAGAFRWASLKREIVPKVKVYKERYDRFITDAAWQVITSAADDQKALDSLGQRGIEKDGREVHSPFAKFLFDALRGTDKKADSNKDGIITATELYLYLRDKVEILTEKHYKRQTPSLCPLRKHNKGEFVFLLPDFDRDNLEDAPPLNPENNPYKGLQSYDEKDSNLFFGREEQIKKLFEKIVANNQPLTLVLGASGTGKSSLMKAALLPRLRHSQEHQFQILDPMRPGESPLKALAQICLPITNTITAEELAKDEQALAKIIERWNRNNPKTKVVLAVDQFEELITLCKSDEEREQFQKLIKNAIAKYPDKIHVVITLRLDFEALFQTSVLKDFWNDDTRFVVPPMTQDELREVIEKPALEKVMYFDKPELVDDLINEVVQMPGALPLLSFTLSELYLKYSGDRTRNNRALTKKDYKELGRVVGSITKCANQEYDQLVTKDPAYKDTVRRVMLRMISLQGSELARRQVSKSELIYLDEEENKRVKKVVKSFSEARLIVEGSNSQGEPYVEPAHDALVQGWDKLLKWKEQEQENFPLLRRLTPAAQEWNEKQKARYLWNSNPYLDKLKELLHSENNCFNKVEAEFVRRSVNRKKLNSRGRWSGAFVVMGVLSIITVLALIGQRNALLQAILVEARIANTFFVTDKKFDALVTAVKAGKRLQKINIRPHQILNWTKKVLIESSLDLREYNHLEGHSRPVRAVAWSPDGNILATGSMDNTVKLWSRQGELISTLEDHSSPVDAVAWSPDGKTLATGSWDKTVKLWNREGQLISTLKDHSSPVNAVAWSPDGNILASASGDILSKGKNTVKLWSRQGELISTLEDHSSLVRAVAWSPDGNILASGSNDNTVKLWNREGQLISTLQGHSRLVRAVAWSPDGNILVSGSNDDTVKLWSRQGQLISTLQGCCRSVNAVAWSSDGNILASAGANGKIQLWSRQNQRIIKTLRSSQGRKRGTSVVINSSPPVFTVAWSPDGKILATGEDGGIMKLWNRQGKLISTLDDYSDNFIVNVIKWSPDGKILASGSRDGTVKLWNRQDRLIPTLQGHSKSVAAVAWSPDGKTLASGSWDKTVKLWSRQGQLISTLQGHSDLVTAVAWSPDGKTLASGSWDKTVKLWSRQGKLISTLEGHNGWVNAVAWSPDGKILATGSNDYTVKFWNHEGQLISTLKEHNRRVSVLAWSPDGKILASGSRDGTVKLWNRQGKLLFTIKDLKIWVTAVAWSPDGNILATGIRDEPVKLWNRQGKLLSTLKGSKNSVTAIAWSRDGNIFATVGPNSTIMQLWNREHQLISTLKGHRDAINAAEWSPDGSILATGSNDNTVRLWNWNLNALIDNACDWLRDYLQNNINVEEENRHLCDGVGNPELAKVRAGKSLARLGYRNKAINVFKEAQQINSKVDLNPDTEEVETNPATVTKELIIEGKLEKGKQLASLGFTDKAIALFKQAQNIDPDVDLDPETKTIDKNPKVVARKLAAPAQVSEGGRLAKEGKITEAIKLFEEAQQFSPEIDLDPNTEEVDRDPEKVAKKLASKPN